MMRFARTDEIIWLEKIRRDVALFWIFGILFLIIMIAVNNLQESGISNKSIESTSPNSGTMIQPDGKELD